MGNFSSKSKKSKQLPIQTAFQLPSPIPTWPPGDGFASGAIEIGGGLQVCQISSFSKLWSANEGGPDNLGATFYEPSPLPQGFSMLGCYAQPNNTNLFGWVLAGKDADADAHQPSLKKPIDYTLLWSTESLHIKQDGFAYVWLPTPSDGFTPVGLVVTTSPQKPSLDKIRCVRSQLTDHCEVDTWIWGPSTSEDVVNIFGLRPSSRGTQAMGVCVGTFVAQNGPGPDKSSTVLACLKNINYSDLSYMPNQSQIEALMKAYSPYIYFHPDETYLPCSVSWFFNNGALLYKKGEESKPVAIESRGANLPQGGANDGAYWLDLPAEEKAKERVKRGDISKSNSEVYLHIKPMLGGTFTDIAIWVFYPFNGPARAKVEFISKIPLGRIGEHVGDWEHVTLRVSNFNGELWSVYLSQHSGGRWVKASELEFEAGGGNKGVAYASLHGHAMYAKPGLVLQGSGGIGIRNDTAKSKTVMDTGSGFSIVAADYLHVEQPPWLNYFREWGPKITYDIAHEIKNVEKVLPGKLKSAFQNIVKSLPNEVLGQEGPTGPKLKRNWDGDEV